MLEMSWKKRKREWHRMYEWLHGNNPEHQKIAKEYFDEKQIEREELQKRLDERGISRIIKSKTKTLGDKAREWVREQLGRKCKKCGFNNQFALEIHRKNGHRRCHISEWTEWYRNNQIPDDVELLCANCHKIETYIQQKYKRPRLA